MKTTLSGAVIAIPAYKPENELILLVQELQKILPGQDRFIIIDDGSGPEYARIFNQLSCFRNVSILKNATNLGKGQALKHAINHALLSFPEAEGIVTADADGQHLPEDIKQVRNQLCTAEKPDLVLGVRGFGPNTPMRSKLGNLITSKVARFTHGLKIQDTQTGLRALSMSFAAKTLQLKSRGYDFEMEMIVLASDENLDIIQTPISTVYLDKNRGSHFNALFDSFAIYFVLMRHTLNSMATAAIDFVFFSISLLISGNILSSMVVGRLFGASFNFAVGKKYVFRSRQNLAQEVILFSLLVIALMLMSYIGIISLIKFFGFSPLIAKVAVESVLFFASFAAQRWIVFTRHQNRTKPAELLAASGKTSI